MRLNDVCEGDEREPGYILMESFVLVYPKAEIDCALFITTNHTYFSFVTATPRHVRI